MRVHNVQYLLARIERGLQYVWRSRASITERGDTFQGHRYQRWTELQFLNATRSDPSKHLQSKSRLQDESNVIVLCRGQGTLVDNSSISLREANTRLNTLLFTSCGIHRILPLTHNSLQHKVPG